MKYVAAALLLAACNAAAPEAAAPVAQRVAVKRGEVADRVVLTGELRPSSEGSVSIHAPTVNEDLTIRFLAEDGATVKAGDRVVEFDTTSFTQGLEDKRIAARDAELTAADADALAIIADADKEVVVRQAEITLEKAKLKSTIPADLLSPHDAQKNELDRTEAEIALVKAKRDLASVRESDALDHHVRMLTRDKVKRALDEAQDSIKALTITAPVDGVFVVGDHPWQGRKFQVNDNAWAGLTLARIPDAKHALAVFADLSDVDDGRVSLGMTGTCTLDAYPTDPVPCTVSELTPVARDKSKTSLRRAFALVLTLTTSDANKQRPGMSVKIVLARAPLKDVLVVPRGAIVFDEDGKTTRAKMASGELREVTLGACDAQVCAIDKGLAESDKVLP
jgi:multidrug efflux pump subunit AcrA (membrane-fusion protein)